MDEVENESSSLVEWLVVIYKKNMNMSQDERER